MAKKASKKKVEKESINESHENQVEDLKLEDQLKEEKDKFLRLFAEFENYKRRTAKERIELFSTAGEEVMISLLPILDDFDRASVEIEKDQENETLKGVLPFLFSDILRVILLFFFPGITLFLLKIFWN